MGRKSKKPFIDKKKAHTYLLVSRSQKDPLAGDASESQYVLKPKQVEEPLVNEDEERDRRKKQQNYGVYFKDDYDYLQHLRLPGTAVLEPVILGSDERRSDKEERQCNLPEELFGSEVILQGRLDKVVPVSGPRPDWDPEIVEALEKAEISGEDDQELEDDFITLANAGEPGIPVFLTEQCDDNSDNDRLWWKGRGDFEYSDRPEHLVGAGDVEFEADDEGASNSSRDEPLVSSVDDNDDDFLEKKTAQFTEYSMTSSVVPRSEALTLLDDHFEEFMVGYNNDQLGALEVDGDRSVAEGVCPDPRHMEYDKILLQTAMEDFKKNFQADSKRISSSDGCSDDNTDDTGSDEGDGFGEGVELVDGTGSDSECTSEEERKVLLEMDETPKKERWDCESVLSTNSTLYNHPTKICEPRKIKAFNPDKIKLSNKTGMPLGVIPGPIPKENHPKKVTITRPRNEDQSEKRERKLAMKEDRKQRRTNKKTTKMVFKAEALKQEKLHLNSLTRTTPVV